MRIKTILIAVLILLVLLPAGAIVYVMSIDYDQYKGLIASEVERATGRRLIIDGKVALALSLMPTLTVKDLSLANLPGGSRPQMILVKRLEVQMQLLPLLSRQVKIDLVVLRGADILLETDKTGHGNWVFSHAETGSAGPAAASGEGSPLPEISLVKIRDSLVTYREGDTGMSRSLRIASLDATAKGGRIDLDLAALIGKAPVTAKGSVGAPQLLSGGAPFPFDLVVTSGTTTARIKGAVGDIVQMQGLAADVSAQGKTLSELGDLAGIALPRLGPYGFTGKAVDVPGGYRINDLTLTMGGSSLKGELALIFAKRPKITADLAADTLDLMDFGVTRGHDGPDDGRVFSAAPLPFALLEQADADLKITAKRFVRESAVFGDVKLTLALNAGRLQVKPLSASIQGGTLVAYLTADGTRTPPPVTLDLTESNAEAGSLLEFLTGTRILTSGRAHLRVNVAGAGNSLHALVAGANGSFDYDMGAGNIDNAYARIFLANLLLAGLFRQQRQQLECEMPGRPLRPSPGCCHRPPARHGDQGGDHHRQGNDQSGNRAARPPSIALCDRAQPHQFRRSHHDSRQHEQSPGRARCGSDRERHGHFATDGADDAWRHRRARGRRKSGQLRRGRRSARQGPAERDRQWCQGCL